MKHIIILALALSSTFAFATPGDTICTGKLKGQTVELLLGYDHHGQKVPSLVEIKVEGKVVFESIEVSKVNSGTKTVYVSNDEETTVKVALTKTETVILSVITDSGLFKATNLKLKCEY